MIMDDLRDYTSKSTRLSLSPILGFVSYVFFKKCQNYAWKSNFNCFTPLSQKKSKSEGKTNGNQLINWQKSPTTPHKKWKPPYGKAYCMYRKQVLCKRGRGAVRMLQANLSMKRTNSSTCMHVFSPSCGHTNDMRCVYSTDHTLSF